MWIRKHAPSLISNCVFLQVSRVNSTSNLSRNKYTFPYVLSINKYTRTCVLSNERYSSSPKLCAFLYLSCLDIPFKIYHVLSRLHLRSYKQVHVFDHINKDTSTSRMHIWYELKLYSIITYKQGFKSFSYVQIKNLIPPSASQVW